MFALKVIPRGMVPGSRVRMNARISGSLAPVIIAIVWLIMPLPLQAQADEKSGDLDTAYVKDLSDLLVGRIYNSTKYNAFRVGGTDRSNDLVFRPTNQYNIGLGASYRKFTLNIGVGIPYLTYRMRERFGHSRYLDAQANLLGAERATNLFLQFWKGYRMTSLDAGRVGWAEGDGEGVDGVFRDDIEQFNFGASTLRVMNSRRFSYRAPMFHDAWQRRSQGSWLLGGHFTYYRLRADSSLVPAALQDRFDVRAAMRRADLLDLGPMAGYAYTVVIDQGFYIMGSLALGAGGSMQYVESDPAGDLPLLKDTSWGPAFRFQVRGGIGYDSRRDQISLTVNHEHVHYLMPDQRMFAWNVGNIRFNIVHRFDLRIRPLDRLLKYLNPRTHPIIHEAIPAIKEAEVD